MKQLCIILISICFFACSSKKNNGVDTVLVLGGKADNTSLIEFEDLFEPVGVQPLETDRECLVTNVSKVDVFEGDYYILDRYQQNTILVFNSLGHFVRRIGVLGKGHGEYPGISDFAIDRIRRQVVVLSAPSKVYIYDMNGTFVKAKDISKSLLWNIISCEDGFICSSNHRTYTEGEDACLFYRFDEEFVMQDKWGEVLPQQLHVAGQTSSILQEDNGSLFYIDNYMNDIYSLNRKQVQYHVELPKPMPLKYLVSTDDFMENQYKYDYIIDALLYEDRHLFTYIHAGKYYMAYVKDGKIEKDGLFHGILPNLYKGGDGDILGVVSAESYLQNWKKHFKFSQDDSIKAGDNYVILRYRIRHLGE